MVVGVGQGRRAGKGEGQGRAGQGRAGADGQDGGKLDGEWWMVDGPHWRYSNFGQIVTSCSQSARESTTVIGCWLIC